MDQLREREHSVLHAKVNRITDSSLTRYRPFIPTVYQLHPSLLWLQIQQTTT